MIYKIGHSEEVGVVTKKLTASVYDSIYRAYLLRLIADIIKVRNNVFLIRNGYVYSGEFTLYHKLIKLVFGYRGYFVFVIGKGLVYLF